MSDVVIRSLDLAEIEMLIGWAKAEGWNPGIADAAPFQAADPEGFIGCFVDGQMAAGISAIGYGFNFGFIGLYIARSDFRGRGYGRRVWDAGMAYLKNRTIGLDGVPEQLANYRSMGFVPNYETFRWSGKLHGRIDPDICSLEDINPASLITFDAECFAERRAAFLQAWLALPRQTKVLIRDSAICGYAVARQCHEGYKIGPLFAVDSDAATTLLFACAAEVEGQLIHIDVPADQARFSAVLEAHGFECVFQTTRMYRGTPPSFETACVFGVTTLELG